MSQTELVVSADGHVLEPPDLFKTRLPRQLRDRGVWEEDFEVEPMEGGARIFRRLHTPGFDGWTISRYRQTGGRMPEGDPEHIIEDMALDGVDVQVMHPNLSLFGLYSDDHELSMAHARVYNDYVVERFSPYFSKLAPTAPIPLTDIGDAVAEIERVAAGGFRAILLPATPPMHYYSRELDPVWEAASGQRAAGLLPHPDRRREGQRPVVHHAQGRHGKRAAGQPADDREVGRQAHDHAGHLQHDRAAADHLRARSAAASRSVIPTCISRSSSSTRTGSPRSSERWTSAG